LEVPPPIKEGPLSSGGAAEEQRRRDLRQVPGKWPWDPEVHG
jgi:hypothetical protein